MLYEVITGLFRGPWLPDRLSGKLQGAAVPDAGRRCQAVLFDYASAAGRSGLWTDNRLRIALSII